MVLSRVAALTLSSAMLASGAAAESVKVAAWNMNNLHFVVDEPLRPGAPESSRTDYELLRKYRDRLGADVYRATGSERPEGRGPSCFLRISTTCSSRGATSRIL